MDTALPTPAAAGVHLDRRHLAALLVTGVASAALLDGLPVIRHMQGDLPPISLASLHRTVGSLAVAYETTAPAKTRQALKAAERSVALVAPTLKPGRDRNAYRAAYAQILTMTANATVDQGDGVRAAQAAGLASRLAREIGDNETVGHAYAVRSAGMLQDGSPRSAVKAAQSGALMAGKTPAAVMALIAEAEAWSYLGNTQAVVETIRGAEEQHAELPESVWGRPGYSLRTYHPGYMKAFAAGALIRAGLPDEAVPRIAEADSLLTGPGLEGIRAYLALSRARIAVARGDYDEARQHAGVGVALSQDRPAAWVGNIVIELDKATGGKMGTLVEQTRPWRY